ncbi:MAG: fumarate hydratase [Firmicutes bacterium HGW-Firmicutes-13]|nr:MAG: fumarate hydratase [Firmicutes bacterium HGW-Firmicutes-13]
MYKLKTINLPIKEEVMGTLNSGDRVLINGIVYTARDAAHKRLVSLLEEGKKLPVDLKGQIIYYTGPSPVKPGRITGSAGPTTSIRMDPYTVPLLKYGVKGFIGKGKRSKEIREALKEYKALYFAAVGGAGALLAQKIVSVELMAYADLGPEAIYRLEVKDFPVVVINDLKGSDLYESGQQEYFRGD